MSLLVRRPGPLSLVEDAGRPGHGAIGVSPSGAADRRSFAAGARLVGNDPARHAAIETTLGGLVVEAVSELTVALTGAACPAAVDDRPVAWGQTFVLAAGQVLTLGTPRAGLRSYLSVAGGIDVPPVLGSRSTDVLSDLGPPRLTAGMLLPVGDGRWSGAPVPEPHGEPTGTPVLQILSGILQILPGPRTDWLDDIEPLTTTWQVSPASNRVGIRLTGPKLVRNPARSGELPSEPLVRGAMQLPPSGRPVIFGPDHPTTGGYPVIAVLTEAASDRLAQCRPGDLITLEWRG